MLHPAASMPSRVLDFACHTFDGVMMFGCHGRGAAGGKPDGLVRVSLLVELWLGATASFRSSLRLFDATT
jgi:hypothetical protein